MTLNALIGEEDSRSYIELKDFVNDENKKFANQGSYCEFKIIFDNEFSFLTMDESQQKVFLRPTTVDIEGFYNASSIKIALEQAPETVYL